MRYVLVSVILVVGVPLLLAPFLPSGTVGVAALLTAAVVFSFFGQARWLNGDEGWDVRILFTRDAWLHPWRTRKERLAGNRSRLG